MFEHQKCLLRGPLRVSFVAWAMSAIGPLTPQLLTSWCDAANDEMCQKPK